MKTISQKRFIKGLVVTTGEQAQPQGSLARISNLVYTKRGSLVPCDGSLFISRFNGALQTTEGPWTEINLFQPANQNRYYLGIKKAFNIQLAAPTGVAAVDNGAGGTLPNQILRYMVSAIDGAGGISTPSAEVSITPPANHVVKVTWNQVTNAVGYIIWRTVPLAAPGTEKFLFQVSGGATLQFLDDNSNALDLNRGVVTINTTQTCVLYVIPANSFGAANQVAVLPADAIVAIDGTPGGEGGGGGGGGGGASSGAPPNPAGGIQGNLSPLPQMVQFANKMILALGNAFPPQAVTDVPGGTPTMAALTNTFTTAYPNWIAAALHAAGDVILPTAGNAGNFVFKAIQGGTSAGGAPVWPQTVNQIVADNGIIWQNTGVTNANVNPRGAAHVAVYAGSLWILNTQPTTTADNLDGPSCLAMSDTNNPNSWNPLNRAFLDRDDGDYGTGLQAFTLAESGIPPTGSLVAFKNFSTFQINGVFGSSQFSIQRAQTDMGCIACRTIQYLPGFGIGRLAHLGIAIFDGTRDKLISEDIRPLIFHDPSITDILPMDWNYAYFAKGAQCANPPMYMVAIPLALEALTRSQGAHPPSVPLGSVDWQQSSGGTLSTTDKSFFRVTKFVNNAPLGTINGELAISPEAVFDPAFGGNAINFFLPDAPDPTLVKYRIYYGAASGIYTNYLEVAAPVPVGGEVIINNVAQFVNTGGIANGLGGLTRVLCYDLVLKNWTVIDLPFSISVLKQVRAPGSQPITLTGGFIDASVRRLQSGDATWDGVPVQWDMRVPTTYGDGATERIFYRRVILTGSMDTTDQAALQFNVILDGTEQGDTPPQITPLGQNKIYASLDIMLNALSAFAEISGSDSDGETVIDAYDWHVEPQPQGAPPIFS